MRTAYLLSLLALVIAGCGTTSARPPRSDPAAERATVNTFWRHLGREQARTALAPAEQERFGGRSAWFAAYARDPVVSVQLRLRRVTGPRVGVTALRVVRRKSGCESYAGTVDLVQSDGRWLIGYLELSAAPCN